MVSILFWDFSDGSLENLRRLLHPIFGNVLKETATRSFLLILHLKNGNPFLPVDFTSSQFFVISLMLESLRPIYCSKQ